MRAVTFFIPFLLVGCGIFGPSAVGSWEGTCTIDSNGYELDVDFEFELDEDKGGLLSGEGLYTHIGYEFEGDVEGERDGLDMKVEIDGETDSKSLKLQLDGELDGDDFTGDCDLGEQDGEFEASR